jgi:hypothetical protein
MKHRVQLRLIPAALTLGVSFCLLLWAECVVYVDVDPKVPVIAMSDAVRPVAAHWTVTQ